MTAIPFERLNSPLAQAIERHKAAQAAYDARPEGHEDVTDPLWTAEGNAFEALAETPCANDAEFIAALYARARYPYMGRP